MKLWMTLDSLEREPKLRRFLKVPMASSGPGLALGRSLAFLIQGCFSARAAEGRLPGSAMSNYEMKSFAS